MDMSNGFQVKQAAMQLAFGRLNRDPVEEDLGSVVVGMLGTESAANIAKVSGETSMLMVQNLAALRELGYDNDSDVAKALIAANQKIQGVLTKFADAAVKHA